MTNPYKNKIVFLFLDIFKLTKKRSKVGTYIGYIGVLLPILQSRKDSSQYLGTRKFWKGKSRIYIM